MRTEGLRRRAQRGLARVEALPVVRLSRTLATLAVRLLGVGASAARSRARRSEWASVPDAPPPGPASATREELLADLAEGRGCAPGDTAHRACRAARELGARFGGEREVLSVLEDTVLRPTQPPCVERAARAALEGSTSEAGRRASARVQAVLERRAEWDSVPPGARSAIGVRTAD